MATQPTNLPVPSESPRDLKFNAGKIDEFVTSFALKYKDRLGGEHYTIEGLRQLAQQAIAAYGWVPMDSFQAGATLTLPNQVLRWKLPDGDGDYYRWDGAFPKSVPENSTPESSGGVGAGKWLSMGDAVLRAELASNDGYTHIGLCPNVFTLLSENTVNSIVVKKYFDDGQDISARYVWDESVSKSRHNGGSIISPSVPWNGSRATFPSFLSGSGETKPTDAGCWVLGSYPTSLNFGADGVLDDTAALNAFVRAQAGNRAFFPNISSHYKLSNAVVVYSGTTLDSDGAVFDFISGSVYFDLFRNYAAGVSDDSVRDYDIHFTGTWYLNGGFRYAQADAIGTGTLNPYSNMSVTAGIRLVKVDGVYIEGITSKYSGYGVELKSCRNYKVQGCVFNENGDDGFSNSDGAFQYIQSTNGLVEVCSAQFNGFPWLGNGSSGFEIDDGPTNITLLKCSSKNNHGRGYDVHTHAGKMANMSDINFVECVAVSNNYPNDWPNPPAVIHDYGFGAGIAAGGKINKISLVRCRSFGHKSREIAMLGYNESSKVNSGSLCIIDCSLNMTSAPSDTASHIACYAAGWESVDIVRGDIILPDNGGAVTLDKCISGNISGTSIRGGGVHIYCNGSTDTIGVTGSKITIKDADIQSLVGGVSGNSIYINGYYTVDITDTDIYLAARAGAAISLSADASLFSRIATLNNNSITNPSSTPSGTGISVGRCAISSVAYNKVKGMLVGYYYGAVDASVHTGNYATNTTTVRSGSPATFVNTGNIPQV